MTRAYQTRAALDTEGVNRLFAVVGHPMRVQLVMAWATARGETSPGEVARSVSGRLGTIAYHVRYLAQHGCLRLTRTVPVRGAALHLYVLSETVEAFVPLVRLVALEDQENAPIETGKALSHPLRLRILLELAGSDRDLTPTELTVFLGAKLGDVSYHVRALAKFGCIEMTRLQPARRSVTHHYELVSGVRDALVLASAAINAPAAPADRPRS